MPTPLEMAESLRQDVLAGGAEAALDSSAAALEALVADEALAHVQRFRSAVGGLDALSGEDEAARRCDLDGHAMNARVALGG
jgi:hypothetical protein